MQAPHSGVGEPPGDLPSSRAAGGGALADVPGEYLQEVEELLANLGSGVPDGGTGGITELRQWLDALNHFAGFSREASLQLCETMTRCMAASPGTGTGGGGRSLQQVFVRLGGIKHVVHTMMIRLSDAAVVAACARVLAAACQGSPVAAEEMKANSSNVRVLLRAIERHALDLDAAEAGCSLIGSLCSPIATAGTSVIPPRPKAYRDSQDLLAEAGALDLLVQILTESLQRVSDLARRAEELQSKAVRVGHTVTKKGADGVKNKVERTKNNMEMRRMWERYQALEVPTARIQEAAIHAITLVAIGNPQTTRMAASVFWCWEAQRQNDLERASSKSSGSRPGSRGSRTSRMSRASRASGASHGGPRNASKESRRSSHQSRSSIAGQSIPESRESLPRQSLPESVAGRGSQPRQSTKESRQSTEESVVQKTRSMIVLPEGDARRALTTLDGFRQSTALIEAVLRCPTMRDRPELAARACRLLGLLAGHHIGVLRQLALDCDAEARRQESKLRRSPLEANDRHPEAPFEPLQALVSTMTLTMRTHQHHAPLQTAALEALAQLRALAMMSAPAGVTPGGQEAHGHWQRLLAEVQEHGEFAAARRTLEDALHTTEVANQRMANFNLGPSELVGDGMWLTPRMKEATQQSVHHADRLAGDVVAAAWKKGDPERLAKKQAPTLGGKASRRRSSTRRYSNMSVASSITEEPPGMAGPELDWRAGTQTASPGGAAVDAESTQWIRALGYGQHDDEDFDRVWREPLTEVLSRTFSCPAGNTSSGSPSSPQQADTLDHFLEVNFVQSGTAKLSAQCVVRPTNRIHQKVSEQRLRELGEAHQAALALTSALSKSMRKSGYLLPKYGLNLSVKRGRRHSVTSHGRGSITSLNSLPG